MRERPRFTGHSAMRMLAPPTIYDPPLLIYAIISQPVKSLIRSLDLLYTYLRPGPAARRHRIRVVCISDTHSLKWDDIPDGDLLIHAGDLTNHGTPSEIQAQINWMNSLPHRYKVAIAGNHDAYLDLRTRETLSLTDRQGGLKWGEVKYLQHSTVTLKFNGGRQLKIYGAPHIPNIDQPEFAFRYHPDQDAWTNTVPDGTDVLVTHTPPKYHLDLPAALGCKYLLQETWRVRPRLHVFGHIHAARTFWFGWLMGGRQFVRWDALQKSVERALSRPDGLFIGLLNPKGWVDVLRVLYLGTASLIWDRVWGGRAQGTLMVNAALMYNNTGRLSNRPQVVDL